MQIKPWQFVVGAGITGARIIRMDMLENWPWNKNVYKTYVST